MLGMPSKSRVPQAWPCRSNPVIDRPCRSTHLPTLPPCPRTPTLLQVPPFSDLPATTGALLVKAVAPANLDAAGEQLFTGLVPDTWCVGAGAGAGAGHGAGTAWVGRVAAEGLTVYSTQMAWFGAWCTVCADTLQVAQGPIKQGLGPYRLQLSAPALARREWHLAI